jgi:hypothetical protein
MAVMKESSRLSRRWLWLMPLLLVMPLLLHRHGRARDAYPHQAPDDAILVDVHGTVRPYSLAGRGTRMILVPLEEADRKNWLGGYPRAVIGPEGAFRISTYRPGDGAPPGAYRLLVDGAESRTPSRGPIIVISKERTHALHLHLLD